MGINGFSFEFDFAEILKNEGGANIHSLFKNSLFTKRR